MLILFESDELDEIKRQIKHNLDPDVDITIPEFFKHNKLAVDIFISWVSDKLGLNTFCERDYQEYMALNGSCDQVDDLIEENIGLYYISSRLDLEFQYLPAVNMYGFNIR